MNSHSDAAQDATPLFNDGDIRRSEAAPVARGRSAGLILSILVAAYILAFVDRQILSLFVQPIKRDLALSDIEVSLLQGLSFALFMCLAGIPVGRLVDTWRRTTMLAIGVFLWSLATAACGFAGSFLVLLVCRVCVGVGEAVMTPAAYSLIGDSFGLQRQGIAMGIYNLGVYIGSGAAMIFGGTAIRMLPAQSSFWGGNFHGWQLVFLSLLVPGLLVATLLACLPEPARSDGKGHEIAPTARDALRWYRVRFAGLAGLIGMMSFTSMSMYALLAWAPAFYQREFGLSIATVGHQLGLIVLLSGSAGAIAGGVFGDLMIRHRAYGRVLVAIGGSLCGLPLLVGSLIAANPTASLIMLAAGFFFLTITVVSGPALMQQVTPPRMRGLTTAGIAMITNLLGLGLGPTVVAVVTEGILHNDSRVGTALALVIPVTLNLVVGFAVLTVKNFRLFEAK